MRCAGMPVCLQQGINPNQALLMNSLRRLLAVSPQLEHRLVRWCGGVDAVVQSQTTLHPSAGGAGIGCIAADWGRSLLHDAEFLQLACARWLALPVGSRPASTR